MTYVRVIKGFLTGDRHFYSVKYEMANAFSQIVNSLVAENRDFSKSLFAKREKVYYSTLTVFFIYVSVIFDTR